MNLYNTFGIVTLIYTDLPTLLHKGHVSLSLPDTTDAICDLVYSSGFVVIG
jgi:hypothetical protein